MGVNAPFLVVWVVNPQTMFGFQLFPVSIVGKALRVCCKSQCHKEQVAV